MASYKSNFDKTLGQVPQQIQRRIDRAMAPLPSSNVTASVVAELRAVQEEIRRLRHAIEDLQDTHYSPR